MSQTIEGAAKARETIYKKYGKDYFIKIGAKGGENGNTGGFASELVDKNGLTGRQRASIFGTVGGRVSRIKRNKPTKKGWTDNGFLFHK